MQELKITTIQSDIHWEDKAANLQMFADKLNQIGEPTDLIVLPEMFSTGFTMNAIELAEGMEGEGVQWMKAQAAKHNAVITGSLIIQENGNYYNRLIWMRPDGSFETYDKRHLFSLGNDPEPNTFTGGNKKLIVELKGWKICPQICYDLRFPTWCRNTLNQQGEALYDLLLVVASWPAVRVYAWKQLAIARAIENISYVVSVSRVGKDGNGMDHQGASSVIDPLGELLYQKDNAEEIATHTLDYERIRTTRSKLPFLHDGDSFNITNKANH